MSASDSDTLRNAFARSADSNKRWQVLAREFQWVIAAAALGFVTTVIGSSILRLSRPLIVLLLLTGVTVLSGSYVRMHRLSLGPLLRHRWIWAVVRGLILGSLLVALVLPDDTSARPEGWQLVLNVVWLGAVYGSADALLLNVLPMMAMWSGLSQVGLTANWPGRIASGPLMIAANLVVTTCYHLGYAEFRSGPMWSLPTGPLGGNFFVGLGYVLAPNPITSIVGHVVLHIAAVLTGTEGPVQLPPHY